MEVQIMRKSFSPTIAVVLMLVIAMASAADEDPEVVVTGAVDAVISNDITLIVDDFEIPDDIELPVGLPAEGTIVVNTWPKWWYFVDLDETGGNDDLEGLAGTIEVTGEPVFQEILDEDGEVIGLILVGIDAYKITDGATIIDIRGPGKPPWSGGPK
jgi:hypothetical protein